MKVKEKSEKASLKLNIQKTKILASGPIALWQIDRKNWKQWQTLFSWAPKITADGDCSHEIKKCLLLGRKTMDEPQFSQFSRSVVSISLWPDESQHSRPPCPSPTPGVHSDSRPSSQWCHPAISSSVVPFSSCLQSLPASESFPMSQLFTSGGQGTGASASVLPVNSIPLNSNQLNSELISFSIDCLISLQSKGLSRVFSNTTVWKHQFYGTQPSLRSNSHIHTWLLEKP